MERRCVITRVNCVPVSELTDKHLLAEYRELPRISRMAREAPEAPTEYKLGKGHVLFFYDKGLYLAKRFQELVKEMQRRGFKTQFTKYRPHPEGLNQDWTPDQRAMDLNRERIRERLLDMERRKSTKDIKGLQDRPPVNRKVELR